MRYYGSTLSLSDVNPNNSYGWKLSFKKGGIYSLLISLFGAPHLGARIRHRILTKILQKPKRNESVFDIGCGFGLESLYLSEKKYKVFGVDKSKHKINIAKKLALELKDKNVYFKTGDIFKLNNVSKKFDNAILFEVLEHVKEPKKMILSISKFLKRNGLLVISFPSKHQINSMSKKYLGHEYIGYDPKDINKYLKGNNMQIKKIYTFGNSWFIKIFFYIDYLLLRFIPLASALFFFVSYPLVVFDMEKFKNNNPMGYVLILKKI